MPTIEIDSKELARLLEDVKQPDKASDAGSYAERNQHAAQRLRDLGLDHDTVAKLSLLPEKR